MEENENLEEKNDNIVEETEEKMELDPQEEISKLKDDLDEQTKKADEYFEHLKRNMAEFDNYKKRMSKEKELLYQTVKADIVADILPIMDNFNTALQADSKDISFKDGIKMIYDQLNETLKKLGLEEIDSLNTTFDPNLHEAVMHVEDEKFGEKEVIEVFRKGYRIGDKVIRHAMVKVAN